MGNDVSKGKYSKMAEGSLRQNNDKQSIQQIDSETAKSDLKTNDSKEISDFESKKFTNDTNNEIDHECTNIEEQATVGATIEKLKKGGYAKMNSNYEEIPTNNVG